MSKFRGDLLSVGLDCKGAQKNFLDTRTNVATLPQEEQEAEEEVGRGPITLPQETQEAEGGR